MSQSTTKLTFAEKAGYATGDVPANFVFQILIAFQAGFYTDVMGISAAALGTIMLLVRFSDAITDPVMGIIADRTKHRWGKFRPWILWSALPFGLLFWATFTVPTSFSDGERLVYAAVTYTLLMAVYTMNNVPYSALMGVMTGNSSERTSVSSFRFVAGISAALIVKGLTLPLVGKLGGGDDAKGWSMTIAIFAVFSVGLFLVTFLSTKERIQPPPGQETDLKRDFADIGKNAAWFAMFGMVLFVFITLALRGTSFYYYFTYYVDPAATERFLDRLGLVATPQVLAERGTGFAVLDAFGLMVTPGANPSKVGFGLYNIAGQFVNILGILVAKPLAERFGKKAVFTVGLSAAALVQLLFFAVDPTAVGTLFLLNILSSVCYGPTIPLLWAMMADVVDYSEWKTGRRSTGFVVSGLVFALKAGLGFGGAIAGWLLASYGYTQATSRAPEVLAGVRSMVSIYSAIPFGLGVICMLFYPLSKKFTLKIVRDLSERRVDVAAGR